MTDMHDDSYDILGVTPTDSWQTVQRAYRRRIARWHPDRFPANSTAQRAAEEETKRLNRAYEYVLERHRHQQPASPPEIPTPAASQTVPDAEWTPPADPSTHNVSRTTKSLFFAVLAVVGVGYWLDSRPPDDSVEPAAPQPVTTVPAALPELVSPAPISEHSITAPTAPTRITVGATSADVLRLLGPPITANSKVWDYGTSRIYFKNGQVTGWYESPYYPLPVR